MSRISWTIVGARAKIAHYFEAVMLIEILLLYHW